MAAPHHPGAAVRVLAALLLVTLPAPLAAQPSAGKAKRAGPAATRQPESTDGARRTVPPWPRRADPAPLATTAYLEFPLTLARGALKAGRPRRGTFPGAKPTVLPRFHGVYAAELWAAGLLLDVVRFNFPLTGGAGEPTRHNRRLGQNLAAGVASTITVRLPWDPRVTRLVVRPPSGAPLKVDLSALHPPPVKLPLPNLRTRSFGAPAEEGGKPAKAGKETPAPKGRTRRSMPAKKGNKRAGANKRRKRKKQQAAQ